MEENFEEFNKNYKGKRSVKYQISEIKENRKVLIVNYKEYSDKIVNISELWVLWYERQRPRGRASKSSISINKANIKKFNKICEIIRNIKIAGKNLTEIKVKSKTKVTAVFIRAHSRRRLRTKESKNLTNKVNKPTLIRIFQAYPAYIRGFGLISIAAQIGYFRLILPKLGSLGYLITIKPALIRIFQAYPAYIKDIRVNSNIPAQIGYFRLILPNLGYSGYLTIKSVNFNSGAVSNYITQVHFAVHVSSKVDKVD